GGVAGYAVQCRDTRRCKGVQGILRRAHVDGEGNGTIVHVATGVDLCHAHERSVSCIDTTQTAQMDAYKLHLDLVSCPHHFHSSTRSPPPQLYDHRRYLNGLRNWQSTSPL